MAENTITVFGRKPAGVPLQRLVDVLRAQGYPISVSVSIAGDAQKEDLDDTNWEAAFVRWREPELHDVLLVERESRGGDVAEELIQENLQRANNSDDAAGTMIVADHLRSTQCAVMVSVLPAMLAEEDHKAWGALDDLVRLIAVETDGLIFVPGEGYCDTDGELLLELPDPDEDESGV